MTKVGDITLRSGCGIFFAWRHDGVNSFATRVLEKFYPEGIACEHCGFICQGSTGSESKANYSETDVNTTLHDHRHFGGLLKYVSRLYCENCEDFTHEVCEFEVKQCRETGIDYAHLYLCIVNEDEIQVLVDNLEWYQ